MDSPVHTELLQWCEENAQTLKNGLIENAVAITLRKAKQENANLILRWKLRVCDSCQENFDITTQGLFYDCKRC